MTEPDLPFEEETLAVRSAVREQVRCRAQSGKVHPTLSFRVDAPHDPAHRQNLSFPSARTQFQILAPDVFAPEDPRPTPRPRAFVLFEQSRPDIERSRRRAGCLEAPNDLFGQIFVILGAKDHRALRTNGGVAGDAGNPQAQRLANRYGIAIDNRWTKEGVAARHQA